MNGRVAIARPARPADAAAVEALRAAARAEVAPVRGGELYLDRLPGGEAEQVWVGELAGEVVGFLSARIDGRLGEIDGLYVDARCRAVGVGEEMMTVALEWFRARGCAGVDATALPGARSTKNFFEETGFTARLLVMHRDL